jgi:hypothetical protein
MARTQKKATAHQFNKKRGVKKHPKKTIKKKRGARKNYAKRVHSAVMGTGLSSFWIRKVNVAFRKNYKTQARHLTKPKGKRFTQSFGIFVRHGNRRNFSKVFTTSTKKKTWKEPVPVKNLWIKSANPKERGIYNKISLDWIRKNSHDTTKIKLSKRARATYRKKKRSEKVY